MGTMEKRTNPIKRDSKPTATTFTYLCSFVEQKLGLAINSEKSAERPVKELSYLGFSFKGKRIVVSEESMAEFKY
jgi:hypothetical protein